MDAPVSCIHGILQVRKLEWVAIPFSRRSSPLWDWIQFAGRNINNLRYADDTTLMAESGELLMKVKEESEKADLNLNIQQTEIMVSSLITSWQIDGETVETVADFTVLTPKSLQMVTAAMKLKDAYSLEEKLWPT